MVYRTKGTCASKIDLDIDQDHIIRSVRFTGGCNGNLQGISKLVIGRNAEEMASLLEGIQCRGGTSCPDQLSRAIRAYHD